MKIVVLDGYVENPGDLSWKDMESLGELTVYDRTDIHEEELIVQRIGEAQIVFTNKTPISKKVMDACPNIQFICLLATGYNVVDVDAASEKGIPVSNIPDYGTASVSQFAIGLLLEACHHIGHHDRTVHEGRWTGSMDWCYWDYPLIELEGKTMGIIGLGRIGRRTAKIADALGMDVIAYSRSRNEAGEKVARYVTLEELLSQSDVISLHCPLFPDTKEIVCRENIEKMKDGVIIINNSRGGLVNEQDLADALNSGKVAFAGLDVVSEEPILVNNPLLGAKNCILTPHISWAPKEARSRIMETAVANLKAFLDGRPANVVNDVE